MPGLQGEGTGQVVLYGVSNRARNRRARRAKARALRMMAADNHCYLCGKPIRWNEDASDDHVFPRSLGYRADGNMLQAHEKCNMDKGNREPFACEILFLLFTNEIIGDGRAPKLRNKVNERQRRKQEASPLHVFLQHLINRTVPAASLGIGRMVSRKREHTPKERRWGTPAVDGGPDSAYLSFLQCATRG